MSLPIAGRLLASLKARLPGTGEGADFSFGIIVGSDFYAQGLGDGEQVFVAAAA